MRIGLDLRLHAYAPGGISRYARRLARALAELCGPEEELVLLPHRRDRQSFPVADGVGWHVLWTPPHHRWERWTLGAELLPLRLDIFHATDFIPPAWGARHMVITVHDLNFLLYPQYLLPEARRYYNGQIAWAVHRADAIVADSYATQRDLVRLLDADPQRITVAHLAADERFRVLSESEVDAVLHHYGLSRGYLLFVGVWEPRKNLPGLLEALALLRGQGIDVPLVIVGRAGWLYEEIFSKVEALGLASAVRFLERVPVEDLVALYNGAAALVMPSFYEGFGLPVLEAMQSGTPVIVSDRASLPEIVGEAGLVIDPLDPQAIAQACERLLLDRALRERLCKAGLQRARTFSWQHTAQQTLAAYRAALDSPRD